MEEVLQVHVVVIRETFRRDPVEGRGESILGDPLTNTHTHTHTNAALKSHDYIRRSHLVTPEDSSKTETCGVLS